MGEQAWGAGMSVWVTVLLFLVGLVLIIKGGDWFLGGAVWIAGGYRGSPIYYRSNHCVCGHDAAGAGQFL